MASGTSLDSGLPVWNFSSFRIIVFIYIINSPESILHINC